MQISLSEWHFSALCDPKVRTIRMQEVISIFLTPNREKGHSSHFNSRFRVNSRGVMASLASQASENVQSQFECRIASFAASSYLYAYILKIVGKPARIKGSRKKTLLSKIPNCYLVFFSSSFILSPFRVLTLLNSPTHENWFAF